MKRELLSALSRTRRRLLLFGSTATDSMESSLLLPPNSPALLNYRTPSYSSVRGGLHLSRRSFLKRQSQSQFGFICSMSQINPDTRSEGAGANINRAPSDFSNVDWDNLSFKPTPTDYMYVMKCSQNGVFSNGDLKPMGNIDLNPASSVLNYGQGIFEGLKAYRKKDSSILLFRPKENAIRMSIAAERMCMPSPTVDQFVNAIKLTVLANKRWVPPPDKGSLYIRPLLMGTGPVLSLEPSSEYTFLVYVTPVGKYFKDLAPIHLVVETEFHRSAPGGTGYIKTIGNYAPVLKAQAIAKANGYSDVLYLDSVHEKYIEEVSSCNIFVVKDKVISTPAINGTILPGITRKSIIEVAQNHGYQVLERQIPVEELFEADEVFCSGTAVVVSPVGSVTYLDKRVEYGNGGAGQVCRELHSFITSLQMGLIEDNMGWTVELE